MLNFFAALEQSAVQHLGTRVRFRLGVPDFLFLHTLGMSMVAGGSATIDLVLLGFWPKTPVKPLERLFPLIWWGSGSMPLPASFC